MNLKIVAVLGAIVVALLCAVLFWPPAETEVPVLEVTGQSSAGISGPVQESQSENSSSVNATADAPSENIREAADVPIHKVGVQVLDHDNWLAIANTKVYYITDEIRRRDPKLNDFRSKDGWARLQDLPYVTTDADGMAVLNLAGRIAYLYCQSGTARGMLETRLGSTPTTEVDFRRAIFLRRPCSVAVQVLRSGGSPAIGIPVTLENLTQPVGLTNEQGRTVLNFPLENLINLIRKRQPKGEFARVRCQLELMEKPEGAIVQIGEEWEAEVVLPSYGRLEFVNLEPGWDYRVSDGGYPYVSLTVGEQLEENKAILDFVPVGASLTLTQVVDPLSGYRDQVILTDISGPTFDGDVVRVDVESASTGRIYGRLLDQNSAPVKRASLTIWFLDETGKSTMTSTRASTNGDGVFKIFQNGIQSDLSQTKFLWLISEPSWNLSRGTQSLSYLVEYSKWDSTKGIALGDLAPLPRRLLLSGKAIDAFGKRVNDITATVERRLATAEGSQDPFRTVNKIATGNRADSSAGEFSFEYSPTPFPCTYELSIQAEDYEFREIDFMEGTEDLVVELRQTVDVSFGFKGQPLAHQVEFTLTGQDGIIHLANTKFYSALESSAERKTGSFNRIPVGTYTFRAIGNNDEVLIEIPGVVAQKGVKNPSLQNLDLTEADAIHLVIDFPPQIYEVESIRGQLVVYGPASSDFERFTRIAYTPGGVTIPSKLTMDDYHLVLAGCKPVNLRGRHHQEVLKFELYPVIPVTIPDFQELFRSKIFWVRLESANQNPGLEMRFLNSGNMQFDPEKEIIRFAVPGVGNYVPVWEIYDFSWDEEEFSPTYECVGSLSTLILSAMQQESRFLSRRRSGPSYWRKGNECAKTWIGAIGRVDVRGFVLAARRN